MGKTSVVQASNDVPGGASREVFQGLFKDLGKQAMALEAILRAVCGRVDKMENWLTEVSFGMTELDLKLRNIAHNIDGTSAVDDEVPGHRWAIPPEDVRPLAPTVSKKLGGDKKTVRVTGMAAAILDRLATTSSNSAPVPTVESEKVDKSATKKKNKEKKHGTKKVKPNGLPDVPATPSPPVVEIAPPPAVPLPAPMVETKQVPTPEVESGGETVIPVVKEEVSLKEGVSAKIPEHIAQVPEAVVTEVEPEKHEEEVTAEEVPRNFEVPTPLEEKVTIEDKAELSQESAVAEPIISKMEPEELPQPVYIDHTEEIIATPLDIPNIQPENSFGEDTPVLSPREEGKGDELNDLPTQAELETKSYEEPLEVTPSSELSGNSVVDGSAVEETEDMTPLSPLIQPETGSQPTQSVTEVLTPAADTSPDPPGKATRTIEDPSASPSISSILPTVEVESTLEPFVLKGTGKTSSVTTPSISVPPTSIPDDQPAQPPASTATQMDLKTSTNAQPDSVPAFQHASSPFTKDQSKTASEPTPVVNKAIKANGVPIRAKAQKAPQSISPPASEATEPTADPLLSHRSARRRSSKVVQRPSLTKITEHGPNDVVHRLSARIRGSNSRRSSLAPQILEVVQAVQNETNSSAQAPPPPQPAQEPPQPSTQPEPPASALQAPPQASEPLHIAAQIEESDESGSEVSSGESEVSSDEDEEELDDDDEEANAAVEEISKTITALNKLKRAQMLSPEEEHELKERAHKKWFQLKGHIKEKQKKDVTNILLKRKKNVFTVSSRIELLEEKSREIFAALKQITNEMREKSDRSSHETLRRRVADIEQTLLGIDSRIASLSPPAVEKVSDIESEVVSLRATVQLQLSAAQNEATIRHSLLEETLARQKTLIETLSQDFPAQINAQTELFLEKLKQQPDYNAAIENLKRSLRRKADLKLLKELEARLLGLDAENEDCLVRCLSCHKEVTQPYNDNDTQEEEQDSNSHLRKVNPGPSSARIYRSNVPFNAQVLVQESISEESPDEQPAISRTYFPLAQEPLVHQSAGDSHASEKPVVRVPAMKWSTPAEINLKKVVKAPQASPLSLMNVTASRAILSPDRPISAPVIAMKKKSTAGNRSKSLLKSLTPQQETPQ